MRRLDALARGTSHPRTLSIITPQMRIAISTGGGDAPGLNAVIRAAVLSAINRGWEVLGIKRGFAGLLGEDEVIPLTKDSVRGIAHLGGTILRTTNRGNPFSLSAQAARRHAIVEEDRSDELIENAQQLGIDALISIGGDGSLDIAQPALRQGHEDRRRAEDDRQRRERHDHDVRLRHRGQHRARGDRQAAHDRGESRPRDRDGGDGARRGIHRAALRRRRHGRRDPHSRDPVRHRARCARRSGRATRRAGISRSSSSPRARFRAVGDVAHARRVAAGPGAAHRRRRATPIAREIQTITGKETRSLVLGHLQRGGMPTGYDRLLATRFGGAAVRAVADEKWGHMVALQSPHIVTIPIEEALARAEARGSDARRRADGAGDGDQLRGLRVHARSIAERARERRTDAVRSDGHVRPTAGRHSIRARRC